MGARPSSGDEDVISESVIRNVQSQTQGSFNSLRISAVGPNLDGHEFIVPQGGCQELLTSLAHGAPGFQHSLQTRTRSGHEPRPFFLHGVQERQLAIEALAFLYETAVFAWITDSFGLQHGNQFRVASFGLLDGLLPCACLSVAVRSSTRWPLSETSGSITQPLRGRSHRVGKLE